MPEGRVLLVEPGGVGAHLSWKQKRDLELEPRTCSLCPSIKSPLYLHQLICLRLETFLIENENKKTNSP